MKIPFNEKLEAIYLGTCIQSGIEYPLTDSDFHLPINKKIVNCLLKMSENKEEINLVSAFAKFQEEKIKIDMP